MILPTALSRVRVMDRMTTAAVDTEGMEAMAVVVKVEAMVMAVMFPP
jgi:hypothetical protein